MTANTPTYSFPYRVATDPPDIAGATKDLADAVEGQFLNTIRVMSSLPLSGVAGQLLVSSVDWRTYRWTGTAWVPLNPNMPAGVLINSQAQPTTSGTDTFAQFDTVEEQSAIGGNPMAGTGTPGTITIREAGLYAYGFRGQWTSTAPAGDAGERRCGITVNRTTPGYTIGTSVAYTSTKPSGSASPQGNGFECTGCRRFSVNDVLRPVVTQSSGSTLWIESTGATGTNGGGVARFWAYKIKD